MDAEYAVKSWEQRNYASVSLALFEISSIFETRTRVRGSRSSHTKLTSCYRKEIIKENNELRICHESIGLKNEQADSTFGLY